jgi:hypothetical protein
MRVHALVRQLRNKGAVRGSWIMARLKELEWWPTFWGTEAGNSPTAEEISNDGVLKNVRLFRDGLTLMVDHKGVICTTIVTPQLSRDALILLRHILLQYYGQPMAVIEAMDIDVKEEF